MLPSGQRTWILSACAAEPRAPARQKRHLLIPAVIVALIAVLVGVGVVPGTKKTSTRPAITAAFWAPALSSSQPVLICMSKPVLYRPTLALYQQYSKTHPGMFQTEVERLNEPLRLDPRQRIMWKDMMVFPDDDLRNSPAVIIGAFSNRWTLEVTSNLRYAFTENDGQFWIEDRNALEKRWVTRFNQRGEIVEDFGIGNRLLNSKTGQLVITVAGIRAAGSDAAAQLVSNPTYLGDALRSAPADWKNKNVQFVVKTEMIDSVAGPPQVIANYFW